MVRFDSLFRLISILAWFSFIREFLKNEKIFGDFFELNLGD